MGKFRILALDGGGIKGAFSASVLATLEEITKCSVVDSFDLITGTSTGGIIALGLAMGMPAAEIRDLYQKKGPEIFPSTGVAKRFFRVMRQLWFPKRSLNSLKKALTEAFPKDPWLSKSRCRLVIPIYDTVAGRVYLFKTIHHRQFLKDYPEKLSAVDVAMATAAAPTYFKSAIIPEQLGSAYIDGGVWALEGRCLFLCN